MTAILFASLVAIVLWPQIIAWIGFNHWQATVAGLVKWLTVGTMILLSFAITFRMGPDVQQKRRWITPGSIFGTLTFILSTAVFSTYVQNFAQYDRTFGSLAGIMFVLLCSGSPAWFSCLPPR